VKQIPWTREEAMLALDLVRQNDWWELRQTSPAARELSRLLQVPFAHPLSPRPERFRSPNSVSRKTADLMTQLPHYRGRATKGSQMDRAVIDEFLRDPERLARSAARLRARILAGEWGDVPDLEPADRRAGSQPLPPSAAADAWAPTPPLAARAAPTSTGHTHETTIAPAAGLAHALVMSPVFAAQRQAGGRRALDAEQVESIVAALLASNGRAAGNRLAAAAGLRGWSFEPTFAALRRLLNVEGYPVVSLADDGVTVRLDERLLREQFGLTATA